MSENTEETQEKTGYQRGLQNLIPWKPGVSGNPTGRPKGARSKLGESFYEDLAEVWKESGKKVLKTLAADNPDVLFAGIVRLQPKMLEITDEREPLNDQQRALNLLAALRALHQGGALVPILERLGVVGGADNTDSGIAEAGPIIDVPPVSEAV